MNKKEIITKNAGETKKLGLEMAKRILNGAQKEKIICLSGNLGAGKTTFTQGLLEGLGAEWPYTSPTFNIVKEYKLLTTNNPQQTTEEKKLSVVSCQLLVVYHIDAYRIESKDILELGWEEMISNSNNVIIVEWAERIKDIIPVNALRMEFEWKDESERVIVTKKHFSRK